MDWGVFLFLFNFLEENVNNCGNVSIVGGGGMTMVGWGGYSQPFSS